MDNVRTRPLTSLEESRWQNVAAQALVFVCLLLAVAVYVVIPFLASAWIQTPFVGALLDPTMVFNGVGPVTESAGWDAYRQGMRLEQDSNGQPVSYQLQQAGGNAVRRWEDLRDVLSALQPGDSLALELRSSGGEQRALTVQVSSFPVQDQLRFFVLPYGVGFVYLIASLWVFFIRRTQNSGRIFSIFCAAMALAVGLLFDRFTTHALPVLWTLALAAAGGSAFSLVLLFPREDPLVRRNPLLVYAGFGAGLLLAGLAIPSIFDVQHPFAYQAGWARIYGFVGAAVAFVVLWGLFGQRRMAWPNDRDQVRWLALASLVSFAPVGVWLLGRFFGAQWIFRPILLLPLIVFPLVAGYSVQRYRMAQADMVLSRGMQYGLLSVLVAVGYALLSAGLSLGFSGWIAPNSPLLAGVIFFVLAMLFSPLREASQRMVDSVFFRGRHTYQKRLQTFSGELTHVVTLGEILRVLRRYIEETLAPSQLHLYIYDPLSDVYAAALDARGSSTSDIRFPVISGLAIRMNEQRSSLLLREGEPLPQVLETDRAKLALLNSKVFVPMPGRQRLLGWLALGERLSGEPYSAQQMQFLEALCDQAALAIERAQVVDHMQNRVREMNVLTLIARGMNVTVGLDEIFELVSTQTLAILPARSFHIMLYDKDLDLYQYAFVLEGADRLTERENKPVPAGYVLEQEVIRQRKAIVTEDYNHECQRRGILTKRADLSAWICVPLDTGSETIGAISLGSADPAVEYTLEQQRLLESIADQLAGALLKGRLLQETERRARQLTTLHDVTRQLTSTLEPEPLLRSILDSAVEILNCEAGSLLMVDPQTDELIFKVVVGPVATDLIEHRMPFDQGVVGQAVVSQRPVIVNDVSKFSGWFAQADMQTGFITRALLAIPLMVKNRVIGVIEVINKKDGTFFSRDDEDLLSAFAAQAAVALENARLYTLTDQALAERVEELSVMQRIDRELNTSLDATQAMQTTLEWAMRRSGANAGLVAVLQAETLETVRVMAAEGYRGELDRYTDNLLPTTAYQLNESIASGTSIRRVLLGDDCALLEGCRSQAIIPIRRETMTIGLLLLESIDDHPISEETLNFLSRLTDHASIAIANAQLYAEVQQANLAKSDFVSFVAHELKNPMTSVKGYTELISAGAVGPVSEAQANFLATIRHNIERMNTLVSDLNDSSKIEVGRLRLDFKAVALNDVLESVVRSTRRQIEEKEQTLLRQIPGDLPLLWSDRTRLEQVLVNLISNAYKYTPTGGTITVSAREAENQWDPGGARRVVHISVGDTGIGISEEDQKKIFQKFFRSEDPKTREVTGTGLGLNITRSLVEMQGGKIWFESQFRQGTTFHFTVPVSEA